MSKRRSNSLVACLAALALLLCQAAGLVHGGALDGKVSQQNSAGCHSVLDEHGQPGKTVHVPCDAAQTIGETLKLPTVTPALLPFAAALPAAPANASSALPVVQFAHAGAPPPLHLLHCRLRN